MFAVNPIQSDCPPESVPPTPLQMTDLSFYPRVWTSAHSLCLSILTLESCTAKMVLILEISNLVKGTPICVYGPRVIARLQFVGGSEGQEFRHLHS